MQKRFVGFVLGSLVMTSLIGLAPGDLSLSILERYAQVAQEPGACTFQAPKGWDELNLEAFDFPKEVRFMVQTVGEFEYRPSLNLAVEPVKVSLHQYLEALKTIHEANGLNEWKKLGMMQTNAGSAMLTQVDAKTQWGDVRYMQLILVRSGMAYVLTASSIKNEFPKYYKEFFNAMRTLSISDDIFIGVEEKGRQSLLRAYETLEMKWISHLERELYEKSDPERKNLSFSKSIFQEEAWKPFVSLLEKECSDRGEEWREGLLSRVKERLIGIR